MAQINPTRLRDLAGSDYGCTRPLAVLGCISILLGSLAVSRWDTLYLIARVGGVVLIVFGVICIVPMIALWTLRFWVKRAAKKVFHHITHLGDDETQRNQALYAADLEYRPAADADLSGPDRELYERISNELTAVGCRLLGDVVNAKAAEISVLRMIVTADGKSWLMLHREASSSHDNNPNLTIDIASEFIDRTFCCTSNSPAITLRNLPPQLRMNSCEPATPAVDMLEQHQASQKRLTSSESLMFITLADVLASQQRKYARTAAFKALVDSNDAAST